MVLHPVTIWSPWRVKKIGDQMRSESHQFGDLCLVVMCQGVQNSF